MLYQFAPCVDELRFVYVHRNPGNSTGAETSFVPGMVKQMLLLLQRAGCRNVAMDCIMGPAGNHEATELNSRAIVNTIKELARISHQGE